MAADDALEAVDARESRVAADVFRETAVDCLADLVETRAGISLVVREAMEATEDQPTNVAKHGGCDTIVK